MGALSSERLIQVTFHFPPLVLLSLHVINSDLILLIVPSRPIVVSLLAKLSPSLSATLKLCQRVSHIQ